MKASEIVMFKKIIKESVKEALKEERYLLYDTLIPFVSAKEQKDIESLYGSPDNYDESEFEDLTDWVLD
jgi:hypothetical protein